MKKIYSYVFKTFVSPLLATFFVSLFVLLMQFLWRYVEDIVGKGLEFHTLVEFFTYSTLTLVPMALPLAILLASLMTFGNLGERLELLSIKAAGVSLFKVMSPLIVFVTLICVGDFFFTNNVLPVSTKKLYALMHEIQHQRPDLSLKEKIFDYSMDDMAIKIGSKNNDGSMLYDVMIYNHTDNKEQGGVTVADSGTIVLSEDKSYSTITLYSGHSYDIVKEDGKKYDTKKLPYRRDAFEKQVIFFENSESYKRPDEEKYGNRRTTQSLNELKESVIINDSICNLKQKQITDKINESTYLANRSFEKKDSDYVADNIDIDSIFMHSDRKGQEKIMAKALERASKVKTHAESKRKEMKYKKFKLNQYKSERHRRYSIPIACVVFFFIGAPLGAIIRKGGFGMPVVVSILFFVVYYVIETFGWKAATESITPIWIGMWTGTFVLLLVGVFLTWKAATDSVIMDSDIYIRFLKKINIFKKNSNAE